MASHVAILLRPYLRLILQGRKTIECRLTQRPLPPYRCIRSGDTIYLKASAGPYMARATAGRVEFFENLTVAKLRDLYRQHNRQICGEAAFWRAKKHSRYGTLVWLTDVRATAAGPAMPPSPGPAWFVLPKPSGLRPTASRAPRTATASLPSPAREGSIEVTLTAGALKNHYVRLPPQAVPRTAGRELRLRLPDGRTVLTGMVGARLRWRGWGRYFQQHCLAAGGRVHLTPRGACEFAVSFQREPRYKQAVAKSR